MSDITIEQMNEAIAKFVGGLKVPHPSLGVPHMGYYCHQGQWWNEEKLQYHSSWDWLMPALLKAKALYLKFDSGSIRDQLKMRYTAAENELRNLNLINTHYCLYQLIQWYQSNKKEVNDENP